MISSSLTKNKILITLLKSFTFFKSSWEK